MENNVCESAFEDEIMDAPLGQEKKDEKQEKKQDLKPVSLGKMYSLCTRFDVLLIVVGTIGALGNAFSQPLIMIVFGDLIDAAGPTTIDIMEEMRESVIYMSIIAAGACISAAFQSGCFRLLALRMSSKLKVLYFEAVINQDITWFDNQDVASLPTTMSSEMTIMFDAYGDKIAAAIQGVGTFVGSYITAFIMGWQMALAILATIPFLVLGATQMGKVMQQVFLETQGWYATAASAVEESLFAMRTVVSFGGERRELARYKLAVEKARKGGVKNALQAGVSLGYMDGFCMLMYGWGLWYASTLVYGGTMNPKTGDPWEGGQVLTVFFCIMMGGFMTAQIEPGAKAINEGRAAGAKFFAALESTPVIQRRGEDERKQLTSIESFELQHVHFSYPARPHIKVLNGASLTIKKGQKIAVVGESGSGKSTVMALLERFYDPSEGKVLVNDTNMTEFSVVSLRRLIGYVGQEPVLFATSIRVNIMQGWSEAQNEDLDRVVQDANLGFLNELPDGLDTFVGSGGSQFSGGQKQRIAIARALLKKPSVLFLDEATSALDNTSEKMIQATIDSIGRKIGGGMTIVSIAHRLSTIMESDRIYALKDGVVQESGTHNELMDKKGLYYGLAASQQMAEQASAENEKHEIATPTTQSAKRPTVIAATQKTTEDIDEADARRKKDIQKNYKVPMKQLLAYCKPEWPLFVPGVIGALAHGACYPMIAYLLVAMLDSFYKPKEEMKDDMTMLAIGFCILGVGCFFVTIMQRGSFGIVGEALTCRLRMAILTHLFRQEIGFHDDPKHTATLMSDALQTWAYRVSTLVSSMDIHSAVCGSIVIGLTIAFIACWQMSLVMMGSIPILIITTTIQVIVMMGATGAGDDKQQAQQILADAVQNARTVHATGIEKMLCKHYRDLIYSLQMGIYWRSAAGGFAFGFAAAIPLWVMAGGFYFGGYLVSEGIADFQGIMTAFMGILFAGMGAGQVSAIAADASKAKIACHDVFALLNRQSQIDGLNPDGEIPKFEKSQCGEIEFKNVKFFYPFRAEVQVLQAVNFQIKAGQSVGLVGPSGGGKSTIMSLIQRFYDPVEGNVLIGSNKIPLDQVNIRWWRKQIGFVGQEPILFDTTVRNNVMYGFEEGESCSEEYLSKCKAMSYLSFIDSAKGQGWDTEVGPRGSRLSGGQKQRVAICRALVRDPPVLLLDEATSALDSVSEKVVQRALEAARTGRTSFAIAHRLSTVSDCDLILVAAEGIILEHGNHSQLMEMQGVYYKLQMQGQKNS